MKLENQVCTLEQAKRLKELGVEGKTAFVHVFWLDDMDLATKEKKYRHEVCFMNWVTDLLRPLEWYSAYNVAELGVALPPMCDCYNPANERVAAERGRWVVYFQRPIGSYHKEYADTEAEVKANMLIWILENNLITADEVNKRLQEA